MDKNIFFERDTQYNSDCNSEHDYYSWARPWLSPSKTINGYSSTITDDYSSCRGLVTAIKVFDASGQLKKKVDYIYMRDSVYTADWTWYNDITRFYAIQRTNYHPMLVEKRITTYENEAGIVSREINTYNNRNQLLTQNVVSPEGVTKAIHYQYCHSSGSNNPSGLEDLISDAVKTYSIGNQTWIISAEKYYYDSLNCARPTKILTKEYDVPIDVSSLNEADYFSVIPSATRMSTFSYNEKQRLMRVKSPGRATIDYTWDPAGKYVLSKSVNGPYNQTIFDWKDLVGLTGLTSPSGQKETYEYDTSNRPWKTFDTDSHILSVYHYKLRND